MVIGHENSSQISVSSTPFILPPGGGGLTVKSGTAPARDIPHGVWILSGDYLTEHYPLLLTNEPAAGGFSYFITQ